MKRGREVSWSECIGALKSGRRTVREVVPELVDALREQAAAAVGEVRGEPAGDDPPDAGPGLDPDLLRNRGAFEDAQRQFRLHYLQVPFSIWLDLFEEDRIDEAARCTDGEMDFAVDELVPASKPGGKDSDAARSRQRGSDAAGEPVQPTAAALRSVLRSGGSPCDDEPRVTCSASVAEW